MMPLSPKNAFRAVKRLFLSLLRRKNIIASAEIVEKRLQICEKCPRFLAESRQCRECTCYVDLKVQLTTEECPQGRWP